jgi:hypothetical protein
MSEAETTLGAAPKRKRQRRQRSTTPLALLLLSAGALAAFWAGAVPHSVNPLAPLDLSVPRPWFLDWRLAALKHSRAQCEATLRGPEIEAVTIPDQPYKTGCGWLNGVRLASAGGAKVRADALTCETAAALAMWMEHDVQQAALQHLGTRVAAVQSMGTYACRNIVGSSLWKDFRSQHATANAIDIAGFTLADGRRISIRKDWTGSGPEAQFLRDIHHGACRTFRVALGPDFNAAHHDHFHFDRGYFRSCK